MLARPGDVGVTTKDNRLIVKAVLYRCRAGILRRNLPEYAEDVRAVHLHHSPWSGLRACQRVLKVWSMEPDNAYPMIDLTIV